MKARRAKKIRCEQCRQSVPGFDIVNCLSTDRQPRRLCSRCRNAEVAKAEGLDRFEHVRFEPVELVDSGGATHVFHFCTNLFGPGVSLDAFELRDGERAGYQFQVIGGPEDDLLALLGQLLQKMRRALAIKHVKSGEYGLQIVEPHVVRGSIQWDEAWEGQVPMLIVDGREISWEQFGHMLMPYEGWQFKLEIRDMSEEV